MRPVTEFVSRIYFEGLPLDIAAQYGEGDTDILLSMLNNPETVIYHENIALTLGMIGRPQAVGPLIDYITAPAEQALSRPAYKGRVGAIMGLSYIVHFSGDERALGFLMESAQPETWQSRAIANFVDPDRSKAETAADLSKYAIIGLGLTGDSRAAEFLNKLGSDPAPFFATNNDLIAHSLNEYKRVSSEGLVNYYRGTDE